MFSARAAVAAALMAAAVAGCSSAAPKAAAPQARSTAGAPAAASSAAARPHASGDANVAACRALEDHPSLATAAEVGRYSSVLSRESTRPGMSPQLSGSIEDTDAVFTAFLAGDGSKKQVLADARKLQVTCARYGVEG
jgi:hypothetical protein